MTMRDMTEAELAAWNGMIEGDLNPLSDVLDGEDGQLHPVLQRWLVKLIRGTWRETDYRLHLNRHPDLARKTDGLQYKRQAATRDLRLAMAMYRHGALENCEAACAAVIADTGKSRATIMDAWGAKKPFILMSRARGVLTDESPKT